MVGVVEPTAFILDAHLGLSLNYHYVYFICPNCHVCLRLECHRSLA